MTDQARTRDLSSLSAQFRSAVEGLTHEWGFIIVRTGYATENDDAQWANALGKLRAYAAPHDSKAEMDPSSFALPIIANHELLDGARYADVRKAFNGWVEDFNNREKSEDEDEWPSDVRDDVCIIIDEPALQSLHKALEFNPRKISNVDLEPWVVVVDAKDPADAPYGGGGPYLGFTRAYARVLNDLYEDLEVDLSLQELSPVREYDRQIPLYVGGGGRGKLIDPEGGVQGRYKFPRGTPRGKEASRAILEEIERAVGSVRDA